MSKSRRSKPTSPRRPPHPGRRPSDRPFRSVASQLTPAHQRAITEGADAELRGDAAAALRLHRSVPMFRDSSHGDLLHQLVELGDHAPGWMINRWLTVQARRRLWTGIDEQATNRALELVVPLIYPESIPFERIGCEHVEQVMPWIYARDWVVRQFDVYDLGGLARLIDRHAAPELLARCDDIQAWTHAELSGCQVVRVDPARREPVVVEDLATGDHLRVLDLGAAVEPGDHVLARIVPVSVDPGLMFDWQPLPVSAPVARAVSAKPEQWLPAIYAEARRGTWEPGQSHLPEAVITSDLPYRSWMTLAGVPLPECAERSPHPYVAAAVEEVLRRAADGPEALGGLRHTIGDLVLDPAFDGTARWGFVTPEQQSAWALLGELVPAPARSRCEEMAIWCAAAPERRDEIA